MGVGVVVVSVSVVGNNRLDWLKFLCVKALSSSTNTNRKRSRQQRASEGVREQNGAVRWSGLANGCFVHGDELTGP
jgi:hypothetical protein